MDYPEIKNLITQLESDIHDREDTIKRLRGCISEHQHTIAVKMQQIIAQLDVTMEKINAEIAKSRTIIRGYEENIQRMQEEKKQLVRAIKAFNDMSSEENIQRMYEILVKTIGYYKE